jgi:hypothetical protein
MIEMFADLGEWCFFSLIVGRGGLPHRSNLAARGARLSDPTWRRGVFFFFFLSLAVKAYLTDPTWRRGVHVFPIQPGGEGCFFSHTNLATVGLVVLVRS